LRDPEIGLKTTDLQIAKKNLEMVKKYARVDFSLLSNFTESYPG